MGFHGLRLRGAPRRKVISKLPAPALSGSGSAGLISAAATMDAAPRFNFIKYTSARWLSRLLQRGIISPALRIAKVKHRSVFFHNPHHDIAP